jgi:GAF domain-containing protein
MIYKNLQKELVSLFHGESNFIANASNLAALLFNELPDISWCGFYLQTKKGLLLGPFHGNPACIRLPEGKGVCGAAATSLKTIIVADVEQFPGHIACDSRSKSEIVVPLIKDGKFYGVLDIDSTSYNRFGEEDRLGLEAIAGILMSCSEMSGVENYYSDY